MTQTKSIPPGSERRHDDNVQFFYWHDFAVLWFGNAPFVRAHRRIPGIQNVPKSRIVFWRPTKVNNDRQNDLFVGCKEDFDEVSGIDLVM